jgi:NAD(P)-dependent dehydrogenase (short-subunit alcohol dehydrogenase family)
MSSSPFVPSPFGDDDLARKVEALERELNAYDSVIIETAGINENSMFYEILSKRNFIGPKRTLFTPWEPQINSEGAGASFAWKVSLTPGILRRADTGAIVTVTDAAESFSASNGNLAYLEADFEDGEVSDVSFKVGSAWDGYPQRVVFDTDEPYLQQKAFLELGKVEPVPDTSPAQLRVAGRWQSGNIVIISAISSGRDAKIFTAGN